MPSNQLEQLRDMTTIVADSGDIEAVKIYQPTDATTNPSLVLLAAQKPEYRSIVERAISYAQGYPLAQRKTILIDSLFVFFGIELLRIIPGRVSTEIDASLSFDMKGSIDRARHIIHLYEEHGIPRERILIKLASTWEGIRAAAVLEMENIRCNMTLLFSFIQAVACAEAKVTLISPFVGRVLDWYKKENPGTVYTGETDPGVQLVRKIYTYLKRFSYRTVIMGASFRNKEEVLSLAGCDLLTISPKLLDELSLSTDPVEQKLSKEKAQQSSLEKITITESSFRYLFNEDAMAVEKLSEGIRVFDHHTRELEKFICNEFGVTLY
jgi:transaldolase